MKECKKDSEPEDHCCESVLPTLEHTNSPRQTQLAYRPGTHPIFFQRMLERISTHAIPRPHNITTRSGSDPAVALLDASAMMLDVLSFYQERIANEGYLLTASEPRSVAELSRMIGYEPPQGVAASTTLVFTAEDVPDAPAPTIVPKGSQVQSIPLPGKLPQTFETSEELAIWVEWNEMRPRLLEPQTVGKGTSELYLNGTDTKLTPGDVILIVGSERLGDPWSNQWDARVVQTVTPHASEGYTRITWHEGLGHEEPLITPSGGQVYVMRLRAKLFGNNAPDWLALSDTVKAAYFAKTNKIIERNSLPKKNYDVTAPLGEPENPNDWPFELFNIQVVDKNECYRDETALYLDSTYPDILQGSWLVLVRPKYCELYHITKVTTDARADFLLSAQVTKVALDTQVNLSLFHDSLREDSVLAKSEELVLAARPITRPVFGNTIELDKLVPRMGKGRMLIVSGKRLQYIRVADTIQFVKRRHIVIQLPPERSLTFVSNGGSYTLNTGDVLQLLGPPVAVNKSEFRWNVKHRGAVGYLQARLDELLYDPASEDDEVISEEVYVEDDAGENETTITLSTQLENVFDRASVQVYANAVGATHGETTKGEIIGSGVHSVSNQRFALKKRPLTYVSSSTPGGTVSTLEVQISGVRWHKADSLFDLGAHDLGYVVRHRPDGTTVVLFGDGTHGQRLPNSVENVVATYRTGIGLDGEVASHSLTQLKAKPIGAKTATNPHAASGAQSPESTDDVRVNAPATLLTFGRIVSLSDYEDFARTFGGISKAQAVALWDSGRFVVHLTVGSASGAHLSGSPVLANLRAAIKNASSATQVAYVDDYKDLEFDVAVSVCIDPLVVADVRSQVEAALKNAFSYTQRSLGQSVTAEDIKDEVYKVAGVITVTVDRLRLSDNATSNAASLVPPLVASLARMDPVSKQIQPAELLLIKNVIVTVKGGERT